MRNLGARLRRLENRGQGPATLIAAEVGETHEQAVERYLSRRPGAAGPFVTVQTGVPRAPSWYGGAQ